WFATRPATAAGDRIRGRDRRPREACAGEARPQGLRLDRRQRRHAAGRGVWRRREWRRAAAQTPGARALAADHQTHRGQETGGAHRGRVRRARNSDRLKMIAIRLERLPSAVDLPIPTYATAGSAGVDLRAAVPAGDGVALQPGERRLIPTGMRIAL